MTSPLPVPNPTLFVAESGPLHVLVEPHSVPLRNQLLHVLRAGGARTVNNPQDAQLIIVDASSDQGQLLVRDWSGTKVCLDHQWVKASIAAGKPLLAADDWGDHLARLGRRDGTLLTPRSSPPGPMALSTLPPAPPNLGALHIPSFDQPGPSHAPTLVPAVSPPPSVLPPQTAYDIAQAQAQAAMQQLMMNPYAMQAFVAQMAAAGYPPPSAFSGWPAFPSTQPFSAPPPPPPPPPYLQTQPPQPAPTAQGSPPVEQQRLSPTTPREDTQSRQNVNPPQPDTADMDVENSPPQSPRCSSPDIPDTLPTPSKRGRPRKVPRRIVRSPSPIPPPVNRHPSSSLSSMSSDREQSPAESEDMYANDPPAPKHPVFTTKGGTKPLKIFLQHDDSFRTRKRILQIMRDGGGTIAHTVEDADYVILVPSRALPGMRERSLAAGNVPLHVSFIEDSVARGTLCNSEDYILGLDGLRKPPVPRRSIQQVSVKNEPRSPSPARLFSPSESSGTSSGSGSRQAISARPPTSRQGRPRVHFDTDPSPDDSRLRSPTPPRGRPVWTAQGKCRFTEGENDYFKEYVRILTRRREYKQIELARGLAKKIPHHSTDSWLRFIGRPRQREYVEECMQDGVAWRLNQKNKYRRVTG